MYAGNHLQLLTKHSCQKKKKIKTATSQLGDGYSLAFKVSHIGGTGAHEADPRHFCRAFGCRSMAEEVRGRMG